MYSGVIYKCLCITTNKVYIGQTYRNLEDRIKQHIRESFNNNSSSYNYHFHRAIRKYGKENFKWEVIETIQASSLENLQELLNSLEIKYISRYDSYHNGYNSTLGGNSATKDTKEIIAYYENGNILGIYENSKHVSQYFNISQHVVQTVCRRVQKYAVTSFGRIIFRYNGDNYLEKEISEVKRDNRNKKVCSYNLDGILLIQFNTAQEAAKFYEVKTQYISKNCSKKSSFVQCKDDRIIFRYEGQIPTQEELDKASAVQSDCKKCVQAIDSVTGQVLGVFRTMSDAGRTFGTKGNKVSEVCSGKRKTSGTYKGNPVTYEVITYENYSKLTR